MHSRQSVAVIKRPPAPNFHQAFGSEMIRTKAESRPKQFSKAPAAMAEAVRCPVLDHCVVLGTGVATDMHGYMLVHGTIQEGIRVVCTLLKGKNKAPCCKSISVC